MAAVWVNGAPPCDNKLKLVSLLWMSIASSGSGALVAKLAKMFKIISGAFTDRGEGGAITWKCVETFVWMEWCLRLDTCGTKSLRDPRGTSYTEVSYCCKSVCIQNLHVKCSLPGYQCTSGNKSTLDFFFIFSSVIWWMHSLQLTRWSQQTFTDLSMAAIISLVCKGIRTVSRPVHGLPQIKHGLGSGMLAAS